MMPHAAPLIVRAVLAGFCVVLIWAMAPAARAGGCLEDIREVEVQKGSVVKFKDYLCRTDNGAAAFRVEFQRLNEIAAGVVLAGGDAPWREKLYGKSKVLENEVWREYKNLLDRFGEATELVNEGESSVGLSVGSAKQAETDEGLTHVDPPEDSPYVIRSFKLPRLPDIPLVDETMHIFKQTTWPESLSFDYSDFAWRTDIANPLDGMIVWRYLSQDDISQYENRVKEYNKLIKSELLRPKPNTKAIDFLRYLAAVRLPPEFIYTSASLRDNEGCVTFDFSTSGKEIHLTVAILENVSDKAIVIDKIFGQSQGSNELRAAQSSPGGATAGGELSAETITLGPSEKLVIPLGLALQTENQYASSDAQQEITQKAAQVFNQIESAPAGKIFKVDVFAAAEKAGKKGKEFGTVVIRKTRESFKPHAAPERRAYAFGPEWSIGSLNVAGEAIPLTGSAANLVLTVSSGIGSCPILYAWDRERSRWVRRGKIIHEAQGRAKEGSETLSFDGFVGRFRISEEELEVARLNAARLVIDLKDGTTRGLKPAMKSLAAPDDDTLDLYANEETEITFALPEDVTASDVRRSRLTVTGYYDRYSTLLLARMLDEERNFMTITSDFRRAR